MMQARFLSCTARFRRPLPASFEQDSEKYGISKQFVNRNPRNLEMMGIAHKRRGWKFQAPRKDFYHRLTFSREGRHTKAQLIHFTGRCVISASTEEIAISRLLDSTTDINAGFNIGRVIAHRCHQVGIDSMLFEPEGSGEAIEKFKEALLDGGLTLEEVEEKPYRDCEIGTDYDAQS